MRFASVEKLVQFDRSPLLRLVGPVLERASAAFLSWIRLRRAPTFRPVTATLALVFVNVAIFECVWLLGAADDLHGVAALNPERVAAGEWWRVLSHGLVHGDWGHVLNSCAWLLALGILLEPAIGSAALLLAYFTAIAAAGAALTVLEAGVGVGASAAVWALQGVLLTHPLSSDARGWRRVSWIWLLLVYFTAQELAAGVVADTSLVSHASGLVVGLWCGVVLRRSRREPRLWAPRRGPVLAAGAVTIGLVAALGMNPDLQLNRRLNVVWRADSRCDSVVAARQVEAIAACADPGLVNDAWALWGVAGFRLEQGDTAACLRLLEQIAPTLGRSDVYRDLATVRLAHDPTAEHPAEQELRAAFALSPEEPETLYRLAQIYVRPESRMFSPARARALALNAVLADEVQDIRYIRTLAWANFRCGDTGRAIRCMRRVIEMNTTDAALREADRAELREMETYALCGPEVTS